MSKEQVYDAEISPLMTQIIAVCKREKIAMVAQFAIPTEEDDGLRCTTMLPDESGQLPENMREAMRSLKPGVLMMTTIEGGHGGEVTMTAILP